MVADSQPAASRSGRKLHGTNVFRDMLQQPSSKTICHLPTTSGAPLCRDDRPDRIIFPDKVFGRQPHLDALSEAYAKYACAGHPTLLLVYGGAGTGKTALVKEARRTVFPGNPFFLHGKFDQYERYTPYNGILRAAKALLEQILTGSDKKNISSRILAAVGLHGKLLTDVLPELELLIGAQPPVSELPPVENEIRFQQVFKKFVTVFAQPTSPLVIFFDDLQWVDQASLNLIQKLLANDRPHHFMIIGAYRDNEVTPPHPLLQTIAELKDAQLPVQTLAVEPLSETYLNKWCMEIFATGQDQTLPLTRTLLKKTDGNPFFARQFLLFCHRADLLSFNAKGGGWQWTIDTIDQCNVNDSVTDLMARRLGSLGPAAREVLSIAACIGYQFDSTTLFTVSGIERKQIITALCEALLEKLITLDEPDSDQENLKTGGFRCRFLHDRIYQAAYALLSNEKRSRLHLKIGTMLLHRQDTENTGEIFEIANHLNEGAALITDDELRLRTANLNLMAGEKAKSAAAYAAAAQYLAAGLKILPTSSKQEIYKLGWNLKLAQAECEYLNGDFTKAEESFLALLQNTQSPLDRARIYRTKVVLYEHLGTPHQSYECGVAGMNLLDFPMPLHPSWCLLLKELLPLLYKLRGKGLALLQNLKP
ncbi:MAG: AAA family ATPase, partial [Desulfobulbaceae bacterium]|nr:AAA family ATPase [Desulfobulbaceae bacterium]